MECIIEGTCPDTKEDQLQDVSFKLIKFLYKTWVNNMKFWLGLKIYAFWE